MQRKQNKTPWCLTSVFILNIVDLRASKMHGVTADRLSINIGRQLILVVN